MELFFSKKGTNGENAKHRRKVFSARLAKVLDLLITSLTTCLFNAKEYVAESGKIQQSSTNGDNSGGSTNSVNFKQKLADKENFDFSKIN